jgi:hypothetical protein
MSIPVELRALTDAIGGQASYAYLLTVGDDGHPHAVAVVPVLRGEALACRAGKTSRANAGARKSVSLVWPPRAPDGYSLIVDAGATVRDDEIELLPTRAVLHRAAEGGGSDCIRLDL